MRVLYLAHDLSDAAIWRRVEMVQKGGAEVCVAGFQRGAGSVRQGAQLLGRTENGKLLARAGQVAKASLGIGKRLNRVFGPAPFDIILARNLEMLCLAHAVRPGAPIVYELLDIHRILVRDDAIGRIMRGIEKRLMRSAAQVWISSPGFQKHYLDVFDLDAPETLLVENKMMPSTDGDTLQCARLGLASAGGHLTIGWFGILRCAWTLSTLDALTRAAPERYRVVICGRPALDVLPNFHEVVEANAALDFQGPYVWPDDLPKIYGKCDLAWLIDRYDAGMNSDWLLPNRLYEGSLHGALPIVLQGTEVARWTDRKGYGLSVSRPDLAAVRDTLDAQDAATITLQRSRMAALPRTLWETSLQDFKALVRALRKASSGMALSTLTEPPSGDPSAKMPHS